MAGGYNIAALYILVMCICYLWCAMCKDAYLRYIYRPTGVGIDNTAPDNVGYRCATDHKKRSMN